jgi:HSP20 family protein
MTRDIIPWRRKKESVSSPRGDQSSFIELHQRMNDLFNDFFGGFDLGLSRFGSRFMTAPSIDMSETDEDIRITADLPGMDERDIQVTLENDILTIKGEKKQEQEEKKQNYHMVERSYGQFQREISIPVGVDREKIKATFKKGVLNVILPKTPEAKSTQKRIAISSE